MASASYLPSVSGFRSEIFSVYVDLDAASREYRGELGIAIGGSMRPRVPQEKDGERLPLRRGRIGRKGDETGNLVETEGQGGQAG